ncbi:MAG: GIY-YIG nuclease family protein [Thermoguttaceae bacterium]
MNRLLEIGFEKVGQWLQKGDELTFELSSHESQRNILYAFVSDCEVKYVGKTVRSLRERMCGYKNPTQSQATNWSNNKRIKELLQSGEAVDIFALPDNDLLHYGQFHVNLAAGLEDNIISKLNPVWNGNTADQVTEPLLSPEQRQTLEGGNSFSLDLQRKYFKQGFFNVRVGDGDLFGSDGQKIEIFCGSAEQPIVGYINRTANLNNTPRIMGGKALRDWFQREMSKMQEATITVLSPTAIRIEPCREI